MDNLLPNELEELILCSCCHLMFNDTDALPKLFSCRHYFCLKCVNTILLKGKELYCIHCWKRTELPQADMKPDTLPTYNAILYLSQNMMNIKAKKLLSQSSTEKNQFSSPTNLNLTNRTPRELVCIIHAIPESLWCTKCNTHVCRACASTEEHRNHTVKSQNEAKESIHNDILSDLMKMQKKLGELQHLVFKQRDFLLKILESCTTLKTQIETELINHLPTLEISDIRSHLAKAKLTLTLLENQQSPAEAYKLFTSLHVEKQRLSSKYNEMLLQCKLDDLIQHYGSLLDFDLLKQITTNLNSGIDTLTLINNNNNSLNGNTSSTTGNQNPSLSCNRTFMNLGHNNLVLLLANYCISQLYSHHILTTKTMAHLSSGASISGSPVTSSSQSNSNNNNNSMFLSGLGVAGMMADQYQLTSSMQEHLLQKYSELSTSPSNHSSYLQSSDLVGNGSVVTGAGSYVSVARSRPTASQLQLQTPPPHSSQTTVPFISDLNGISMPITIMQHNLQHSNLHLHQGTSSIVSTNVTTSTTNSQATTSIVQNPTVHVYPIFFFDIEINGNPFGRILIEVRNDVAPKMSKNFSSLATMELGYGYKGCNIFQCWENESIITGDFELNNGRGGRSVFEESFFMPDDTKILAIRGSVGMRRSQKRHDNMGLVGSQFRIILREMRGFTGIFAFVVEGLDLVDKISKTGDSAGKPQSNVIIVNCGKWQ